MSFWEGFEKRAIGLAAQAPSDAQPEHSWRKWVVPTVAAGAGLGTFLLKRRNRAGMPSRLVREVHSKFLPKGGTEGIGGKLQSFLYGADEVVRTPSRAYTPATKPNVQGMLFSPYAKGESKFMGTEGHVLGNITGKQLNTMRNKKLEQQELAKHFPKGGIETHYLSARHKGSGFRTVHDKMMKEDKRYFIKGLHDASTGVGGGGFINSDEMHAFYTKKKTLPAKRVEQIKSFLSNPQDFMVQKDIGILKTPITNVSREFRVHTARGKIVPGATSIRSGNVEDVFHKRKIEAFYQKYLDSLPPEVKRKMAPQAADVAMTASGPKIIETNTGLQSGLMTPGYLWNRYKNESKLKALGATAGAVRTNLAYYKHLTGKEHVVPAAAKALGAAGLTYGGGQYIANKMAPGVPGQGPIPANPQGAAT